VVAGWHGSATRRGGRRSSGTLLDQCIPGKPRHPLAHADIRDPAAGGTGSVPCGAPRRGGPVAELMPSPAGALPCNPAQLVEVWIAVIAHVPEAIAPGAGAARPRSDSLDLIRRASAAPAISASMKRGSSRASAGRLSSITTTSPVITLTRDGGSGLSAGPRTKVPWHRAPSNPTLSPHGYAQIRDSVSPMFGRSMFATSHSGNTNFDALSAFQGGTSKSRCARPKRERRVTAEVGPSPSDQEGT
jgi:hypothetical protein